MESRNRSVVRLARLCILGVVLAFVASSVAFAEQQSINVLAFLSTPFEQQIMEQFTKDTGIKVNLTAVDYNSLLGKITTGLISGASEYDVVHVDGIWIPQLKNYLVPLDSQMASVKDQLVPVALHVMQDHGVTYGFPIYTDFTLFYYNKQAFTDAGLDPNSPPTNWQQLEADAKALTKNGNYGLAEPWTQAEMLTIDFQTFLEANGGSLADPDTGKAQFDSTAGVQALTFMKKLWDEGVIAPGAFSSTEDDTSKLMQQGKAAMMINWPYADSILTDPNSSNIAGHVGVAINPTNVPGASSSVVALMGYAIPKSSKKQDLAWKFIQYVTSKEASKERAIKVKDIPVYTSLFNDSDVKSAIPYIQTALAQLQQAVPVVKFKGYAQASHALQVQLQNALAGRTDPKTALDNAAKTWNSVAAKAQ